MLPTRDHIRFKYTHRLEVREWKKVSHASGNQKKGNNTYIRKNRLCSKRQRMAYIMIKRSILQKGIMIINIYAPNIGAPQYIRQILTDIKGEINSNTIIVRFLTSHLHHWTYHPEGK